MEISHPYCKLITLKNDTIILTNDLNLLDINNFDAINKELEFLRNIRSKFRMHELCKLTSPFLFYHSELRANIERYLEPYGYSEISQEDYYDKNLKKIPFGKNYTPYAKWMQIFAQFERFGIIKQGKVIMLTKDLIEPTICNK